MKDTSAQQPENPAGLMVGVDAALETLSEQIVGDLAAETDPHVFPELWARTAFERATIEQGNDLDGGAVPVPGVPLTRKQTVQEYLRTRELRAIAIGLIEIHDQQRRRSVPLH
jgi:hypothetical protein